MYPKYLSKNSAKLNQPKRMITQKVTARNTLHFLHTLHTQATETRTSRHKNGRMPRQEETSQAKKIHRGSQFHSGFLCALFLSLLPLNWSQATKSRLKTICCSSCLSRLDRTLTLKSRSTSSQSLRTKSFLHNSDKMRASLCSVVSLGVMRVRSRSVQGSPLFV